VLFTIAFGCSIASGAALPLMTIIFGQFTSEFTDFTSGQGAVSSFSDSVNQLVLYFVYLFVARLVVTYVGNVLVNIAALRTTRAIRYAFLEKTLRQEVWHFDKESIGSISSQVTTSRFPGEKRSVPEHR
jgi:ATP-binding cassette, subfamily B (MDR/TAP), member 1